MMKSIKGMEKKDSLHIPGSERQKETEGGKGFIRGSFSNPFLSCERSKTRERRGYHHWREGGRVMSYPFLIHLLKVKDHVRANQYGCKHGLATTTQAHGTGILCHIRGLGVGISSGGRVGGDGGYGETSGRRIRSLGGGRGLSRARLGSIRLSRARLGRVRLSRTRWGSARRGTRCGRCRCGGCRREGRDRGTSGVSVTTCATLGGTGS